MLAKELGVLRPSPSRSSEACPLPPGPQLEPGHPVLGPGQPGFPRTSSTTMDLP